MVIVWPWNTKWSRTKANRVLPRECADHSKHPLPTTQEMTLHIEITRWSILKLDWYILCSWRWRSSIQSAKTRPGADCGSNHELFIAKFRLKLKKLRKTTWPFRYDLNKILYGYTVEVINRLKGLALIDIQRLVTLYWRQWLRLSPRKRNATRQHICQRRPCK